MYGKMLNVATFTPPLMEKATVAPDVTLRFTVQPCKSAGKRTTLALKPMGRVTRNPK